MTMKDPNSELGAFKDARIAALGDDVRGVYWNVFQRSTVEGILLRRET
jgi:hypothetical protein